jgi:hypothetical protein
VAVGHLWFYRGWSGDTSLDTLAFDGASLGITH